MPLTLSCFCPGDTSISICTLTDIIWHVRATVPQVPADTGYGLSGFITLKGGPYEVNVDPVTPTAVSEDIPLGVEFADYWSSLYVRVGYASSLFQPYGGGSATMSAQWWLEMVFSCFNTDTGESTTRSIIAKNTTGGENACSVDDVIRGIVFVGPGAGGALLLNSSAFSPCGSLGEEVFVDGGDFEPTPDETTFDLNASPAGVCICATGGTAPYLYSISAGSLPSGKTFDAATGCFTGEADGITQGTPTVTFKVTDMLGETAEVTCNLSSVCTGVEIGNVQQ